MPSFENKIKEALKDQISIFGDELFQTSLNIKKEINIKPKPEISEIKKELNKKNIKFEESIIPGLKEDWENTTNLEELNKLICNCLKCSLGETRNKFVFGKGNENADVMVIGEGPGADEDKQGEPFVGRAGKLLTDILKAINFSREEVYIANIVKCRPPDNRNPSPEEMSKCIPYLKKQIELIKPKFILCLGLTASYGLLNKKDSLTNLRGNVFEFENAKVMVTYHPAALLRNPNWKHGCWDDVKKFRKLYDDWKKKN